MDTEAAAASVLHQSTETADLNLDINILHDLFRKMHISGCNQRTKHLFPPLMDNIVVCKTSLDLGFEHLTVNIFRLGF